MKRSKLLERYSDEKMLLELHKPRKVKRQNDGEITIEITGKQKEVLKKILNKIGTHAYILSELRF